MTGGTGSAEEHGRGRGLDDLPTIDGGDLAEAERDEASADEAVHPATDVTSPAVLQRVENGFIAATAMLATVTLFPMWWWVPLALFLLFDLSMVGYLRSTRAGAVGDNLVHSYVGPGLLGVSAVASLWAPSQPITWWAGLFALSWAFHIGVDRMLGYGLKLPDSFQHTHLGWIGRRR